VAEQHPSFSRPTICEALCEIHFSLPEGEPWKPAFQGNLFKHLQPDFPEMEPISQVSYRLQIGRGGVEQTLLPAQRMSYVHARRPLRLQLAEGVFTVNEIAPYPGWENMKADIFSSWTRTREVVGPAVINRIGLRYINHLRRGNVTEPVGAWLAPSDYVPSALLRSLPGFMSRLQTVTAPRERRIVTIGETVEEETGQSFIVFDIDCISEHTVGPDDREVAEQVEELHGWVWDVFVSSMTPRLEAELRGGVS
jgi:uncharacterized protein (TIGR04255 family)